MTDESANWCRFAKLMIDNGAKVLRTFIQVEIITSIFRDYSTAWRERMNAINVEYTNTLWGKLDCKFGNSILKPLEKLRGSWSTTENETPIINEQIDELKEWKKNIEQEQKNPLSDCVKKRMDEWKMQIEHKIQKLNKRHTLICKWSDTFLIHMYKYQRDLFLQIEENHKFLNEPLMSKYQLSLESLPNGVEVLKSDLQDWRNNCYKVLLAFRAECDNLIKLGQEEATGDKILTDCLKQFKNDVEGMKINLQVETLCDSWYTELEEVFRKCEDGDYEEAIKILETIPSFREMKIKKFFSQLIPQSESRKRKRMERLFSKFKNVSGAKDLENLDLTLLVAALKEIGVVNSHSPYWDDEVPDWDTSTGADILRLKSFRNDIVAHIPEAKLSSKDFDDLWGKVKSLLCNIALRCGDNFKTEISLEIDTMKTLPLEPLKIRQLRHEYTQWCKQDIQFEFPSSKHQLWDFIYKAEENMRKVYPCSICKIDYSTEDERERHRKSNHVYPCSICKIDYSTEDERERHWKSKHVYPCSICKIDYSTDDERERHWKSNHVFPCPTCKKQCSTEEERKKHRLSNHVYPCSICKIDCSTEDERERHRLSKHVFPCPTCMKQFSTEEEREKHRLSNHVFPCPSCNKRCSTEEERETHRWTYHVYKCSSCNEQFSTEKEREEHMSTHKDNSAVGVLAGAGSGAAVGLVLGPPGAVVGAAIGGIIGLFSGRK